MMFTNRTVRPILWGVAASILLLPACAAKPKTDPKRKPEPTLREFLQSSSKSDQEGMGGGSFRFPDR
ncbi:MAG: hypothetical protein Q8M16_11435 [Pirellulaceae bacterium]|nr:hypothetical protein [Pirellulaceae bacterium]